MNSSNNAVAPPRRFEWLRRLFWAAVCLVSLITALWQWENWRSARELKTAHARLIERIGTDDPLAYAPPKTPDAQNFFALPVIEQWATEPMAGRFKAYKIPPHVFLPPGFTPPKLIENEADGNSHLDFTQTSATELDRLLGDANGLLPQLHSGLVRPTSCLKPQLAEALESEREEPFNAPIPNIGNMNDNMRHLGLHLRIAAHAGNREKTASTALILLRLFPESSANHGCLVSCLVSLACHGIAFEALQDALSRPVWSEDALRQLQLQLRKHNDLQVTQDALIRELLWAYANMMHSRQIQISGDGLSLFQRLGNTEVSIAKDGFREWLAQKTIHSVGRGMPVGWLDANVAHYLNHMLDIIGPDTETQWLQAPQRLAAERRHSAEQSGANPRRIIANIALPNIGNLFGAAAETLFHRRCLILACELEKHRMQHGSYPTTLPELKGYELSDPARPGHLPGYHLEPNGYLLWSAGPNAIDDGGVADKDWLWRMKRTP